MSVHLCHKLWINCWYINLSNWFTISPSPLHAIPSNFKSLGSAPGGANYPQLSQALSVLGMMMHSLSTLFPAIPGRLLEYSNCSWRCCFAPSTPVAPSSLRSLEHKHILVMYLLLHLWLARWHRRVCYILWIPLLGPWDPRWWMGVGLHFKPRKKIRRMRRNTPSHHWALH